MSFEISQIVIAIVVICLFLWRISYGTKNGLFAEAAGLIAVIAAFAAVYYIMNIGGSVIEQNFGSIVPKIGCLVVAFIIYRVMTALGRALKEIREVPVLGFADRILGAVMGAAEALIIVLIVQFVTQIKIIVPMMDLGKQLWDYGSEYIKKLL